MGHCSTSVELDSGSDVSIKTQSVTMQSVHSVLPPRLLAPVLHPLKVQPMKEAE